MSKQIFENKAVQPLDHTCMSLSPQLCGSLLLPYSKALSTAQARNRRTQPCIYRNTPSGQSTQCGRCFVPVLVCVEQGDTAARVRSLWAQGVGVIRPDHKETSSLQSCTVYPPPPLSGNNRSGLTLWSQSLQLTTDLRSGIYNTSLFAFHCEVSIVVTAKVIFQRKVLRTFLTHYHTPCIQPHSFLLLLANMQQGTTSQIKLFPEWHPALSCF